MSSYLFFKKGNTELCCFQSSHPIYDFFHTKKYEEWEEVDSQTMRHAIDSCREAIDAQKHSIDIENEIISKLSTKDDISDAVYEKDGYLDELKILNMSLEQLYLLRDIAEFERYNPDTGEEFKEPFYIMKD